MVFHVNGMWEKKKENVEKHCSRWQVEICYDTYRMLHSASILEFFYEHFCWQKQWCIRKAITRNCITELQWIYFILWMYWHTCRLWKYCVLFYLQVNSLDCVHILYRNRYYIVVCVCVRACLQCQTSWNLWSLVLLAE